MLSGKLLLITKEQAMPFQERYLNAINSANLQDDELHHQTEVLAAAALADLTGGSGVVFGSMLTRAKYGNGAKKIFDSGIRDLAVLLRIWKAVVKERARERGWFPTPRTEWDANAIFRRLDQIAEQSLAHWIGGHCESCNGTAVGAQGLSCKACAGTGKAPITGDNMVADRTRDMVSELEGLAQSHGARANAKLKQAA
jgi:hypothetical protein